MCVLHLSYFFWKLWLSFHFLFLKLNLFPALHLCCSPFPSADWALLDCVIDRKVRDIFECYQNIRMLMLECYQNIQDNREYNSVLPFRIILKIFAVNMLGSLRYRSSHKRCSIEIGVLKNFTNLTREQLRQSLFLNKAKSYFIKLYLCFHILG